VETTSADNLRGWQQTWELTGIIVRAIAAYDGERIVGTCATKPFELTVPGPASIPVAGITAVSPIPDFSRYLFVGDPAAASQLSISHTY